MILIPGCQFGFEDGRIISYHAEPFKLVVNYEFWNEQIGKLIFEGLVGVRDMSAIRVTVSAVTEKQQSELVKMLIGRRFEHAPNELHWRHFQFLDLDDQPMFDVVADSCSFSG
jgi:hypothetical protein